MIEQFPEVLARARAGDPDALGTLYRALNPGIERYVAGRAPDSAEDLAAETWVAVAESIERFRGDEADFRGWVFTIARNRVTDDHRRSRRRAVADPVGDPAIGDDDRGAGDGAEREPAGAAEDAALAALETEAVLAMVRRLPPDQADVIMLRVVAGLDTDRVARVLGKRPGTVRVLQHRGLRNLERYLADGSTQGGSQ